MSHESHEKEEQKNEDRRYPTILQPTQLKPDITSSDGLLKDELELEKMLLIETDSQLAKLDKATELSTGRRTVSRLI